ncbi:hypothetical protein HG536_0F04810 [Torulaspora globosa]|uniref:Potassium channel domain-containing protein n=1 Tax=Torulaspora globosa TaxID=48254 RepID=A0A7G3ZKW7_9SACH|nr:uncharacterized protein HG536_0F04810 [Torulaspora globosa]QLL34153.1 hypothetical protein HG536_0F04810 [Torulaspora globosa]
MRKEGDNERQKQPALGAALQESISFDAQRVSIIRCDATSVMFVFWFHVSCYFPVLTACLGPIGNTISIACVVEKWRLLKVFENGVVTGSIPVSDPGGIFAVNVISLVLGFISNIALLLHFGERLSYLKAQWICIVGWTAASFMLMIDVIMCGSKYMGEKYEKSIGYWFAAITSGLYFGCTLTLTTHFVGYLLGKYPARFNLIKNERSLMVFTVSFSIILIWGGGMFSGLLHVSFGNSLYFCVVSILTIGLGDIVPVSLASRILLLFYSLLGFINLALIIAMTTGIFRSSSGPVVFFHKVEVQRKRELFRIKSNEICYTSEEAFSTMQRIRKKARSRQKFEALLFTLLAFVIFWHLGSLGLRFAEGWSYFVGMYFCFLCLLTIGYGDYAPASGAGRALFVLWALGAVPMMSAILSNVGDILLEFSDTIDVSIAKKFKLGLQSIIIRGSESWNKYIVNDDEILPEDDSSGQNYDEEDDNDETDSEQDERNNHSSKEAELSASSGPALQELRSETPVKTPLRSNMHENAECDLRNTLDIFSLFHKDALPVQSSFSSIRFSASDLHRMLSTLRKFRSIAQQNKHYCLTFNQWRELHELHSLTYDASAFDDPAFWLSECSPLRFPLNQPKFVALRLFSRIEQIVSDLLTREERSCYVSDNRTTTVLGSEAREQGRSTAVGLKRARSATF